MWAVAWLEKAVNAERQSKTFDIQVRESFISSPCMPKLDPGSTYYVLTIARVQSSDAPIGGGGRVSKGTGRRGHMPRATAQLPSVL